VISDGKFYCCIDIFTVIRFTSLLAKNIKKKTNFYAVRISISLAIMSEFFNQIGYFFIRVMQENKSGFFSEYRVAHHLLIGNHRSLI